MVSRCCQLGIQVGQKAFYLFVGNSKLLVTVTTFPCTLKLIYSHSSIRPFNWTIAIVPVYKQQGRIDLLTEVCPNSLQEVAICTISASCYWTFIQLTYHVTYQTTKEAANRLHS